MKTLIIYLIKVAFKSILNFGRAISLPIILMQSGVRFYNFICKIFPSLSGAIKNFLIIILGLIFLSLIFCIKVLGLRFFDEIKGPAALSMGFFTQSGLIPKLNLILANRWNDMIFIKDFILAGGRVPSFWEAHVKNSWNPYYYFLSLSPSTQCVILATSVFFTWVFLAKIGAVISPLAAGSLGLDFLKKKFETLFVGKRMTLEELYMSSASDKLLGDLPLKEDQIQELKGIRNALESQFETQELSNLTITVKDLIQVVRGEEIILLDKKIIPGTIQKVEDVLGNTLVTRIPNDLMRHIEELPVSIPGLSQYTPEFLLEGARSVNYFGSALIEKSSGLYKVVSEFSVDDFCQQMIRTSVKLVYTIIGSAALLSTSVYLTWHYHREISPVVISGFNWTFHPISLLVFSKLVKEGYHGSLGTSYLGDELEEFEISGSEELKKKIDSHDQSYPEDKNHSLTWVAYDSLIKKNQLLRARMLQEGYPAVEIEKVNEQIRIYQELRDKIN